MSVYVRIRNGMQPDGEGNGGASEGDIRGDQTDIISGAGVVDKAGGQLLVHENSPADMNVIVDEGIGYIPNSSFDEFDSDSVRFWEAVVGGTEGSRTLAISANASGSTRIDLVCLKMDTGAEPDYYASDVASLIIVEGTPGAGEPSLPANHLKLAVVTVENGTSDIENADIDTDDLEQAVFNDNFIPSTVLTASSTHTVTNKRITKRVQSVASSATPTPNIDSYDIYQLTALAAAAELQSPTGTPTNGQGLIVRILDNGTARALTYNSIYRAIGVTLPATTIVDKTLYLGFIYNSADSKWDCVAVQQEY